jgi:XTP/dITP diphosphohydrolase
MKIDNKIIIASNNAHKIKEIKEILQNFNFEVVSLSEAGVNVEVEEDGKTFEENAFKKAKTIMDLTGQASLADDSGLEVYALNGAPGVYSARFSGEHGNDSKNNEKLLELMKEVPDTKRGARFVSSIVLLFPDGRVIKAEGYAEGKIGQEEKGIGGFGYDPLFFIPKFNKTFAQLGSKEKNAISHRGEALKLLKQKLGEL